MTATNPNNILSRIPRVEIALLGIGILLIGLVCSKFAMSIGMWLIVAAGFLSPDYKKDFARLLENKSFLVTTGIFWIILFSGIYTDNWADMLGRLRVALPFLVLAPAFGMLPKISERQYNYILYFFVLLMLVACIWILGNYLLHYEAIQMDLYVSKAIPTPSKDHVRFSLLLVMAIYAAGWLLWNRFYARWPTERYLLSFACFFLWVMLHVLSVRSGLLAFYVGSLVFLVRMIVLKKQYLLGGMLFCLVISVPIAAYYFLPSFHTKVHLTLYNIEMYRKGEIGDLSDTQRLLSYQVAIAVAAKNPILGVGMGDLHDEQRKYYEAHFPNQQVKYPHNQFLSFYAGTGILGLLLFLICFLWPLWDKSGYKDMFLLLFYTLIFTSFLTENTIFISIGTAIYTLFLLLHLNATRKESTHV